jgi:hypothetical protein
LVCALCALRSLFRASGGFWWFRRFQYRHRPRRLPSGLSGLYAETFLS